MASLEHHSTLLGTGLLLLLACSHTLLAAPAPATDTKSKPAAAVLTVQERQYLKAIAAYRQTIAKISASQGPYNKALLEPLVELGRTLIQTADFDEAAKALHRAQNILHRNEGVYSPHQLAIVDLLQEVDLNEGKPLSADQLARFSLFIDEHNLPADSLELLPSMFKLADWYMDTGQNDEARRILKRAGKMVTTQAGPRDPRMIAVLEREAKNARLGRRYNSYKYLEKARDIVKSNPKIPTDERAQVYASLGDAYIESDKDHKAAEAYKAAWKLLGNKAATEKFSQPKTILASRDLDPFRKLNRTTYVPDSDPVGTPPDLIMQGNPLLKLSDEELIQYPYVPPQAFTVVDGAGHGYQITRRPQPGKDLLPAQRLSGKPFRFIRSQLMQIIFGANKNEQLANTVILLNFTVGANGKTSNVKISGDKIPRKLRYLMQKVVQMARFRPRIVDGKPVATEHVKVVQTFN